MKGYWVIQIRQNSLQFIFTESLPQTSLNWLLEKCLIGGEKKSPIVQIDHLVVQKNQHLLKPPHVQ